MRLWNAPLKGGSPLSKTHCATPRPASNDADEDVAAGRGWGQVYDSPARPDISCPISRAQTSPAPPRLPRLILAGVPIP
jgi:hypothetical protein